VQAERRLDLSRNHPRAFLFLGLALLLVVAQISHAQSPEDFSEADFFDDLPVVLSASRLLQPLNEAPVAVTVIDQEMIRASGFRDIPDLLRLVPGFSVAYTQFNTWTGAYHGLGDGYFRRFQVRVDGRSIYSPHNGAVLWSDLPLSIDDIERIEVVRGPDAAVYGANAFSGVINIITKTAAQVPGGFVSMQAGTKDMRGLTARYGGGDEALRYRVTASAQQRDRFERDTDGGQFFEASQTYFVNGRLDWQLAPDADLMAQFGLSQGNWDSGSKVSLESLLEPTEQDSRAQYFQATYHKVVSERREWQVQFYHSQNRFDANQVADFSFIPYPTNDPDDPNDPDYLDYPVYPDGGSLGFVEVNQYLLQRRTSLDLVVNEQWTPSLRGVWGGEIWHESVKSPQNYYGSGTLSGTVWRMHGNLEWRAHERVLLHGGALLEHHYITGTDVSPRLAANVTLAPGHVVRLGISRAYRSPTFFEESGFKVLTNQSGQEVDFETVPSEGLDPERILSREIGYVGQWPKARLEMDVRLFDDDIEDFIGDASDDVYLDVRKKEFQYANRGSVNSRGGEIQLRWRPVQTFDVSAYFAHVLLSDDFMDINVGKDIPQSAPRNSWGLLARFLPGDGWEGSLFVQQADDIKWLEDGDFTEGFTRVDVRVARRWNWQGNELEAALVGQNLGDDYSEFRESNIFSRRVYGSFSVAW
jgi:iron complex outermembrane recepter protein